ncbi:MAG: 3-alpha,7-alpha,12-alpha-trihydroxy-5-beta-cholest-24-enoyl-CoA hydratase [Clostridia bacterium]|nr:3-alpha,7-alpha,12-alpha-trihydroxy-5-beta-cholest-24-enoyl-CoA hydratase [Clostridia bacterium]
MGLKFEMIGQKKGPLELEYDWKKLALYALSVGANVDGELEYVYEKDMKIIPTYWAAILGFEEFTDAYEYGQNIPTTLHFGFDITYHAPITQIPGKIHYTIELLRIYDRGEGRGSLAEIEAVGYTEQGEKAFTLVTRDIDLSTGGFGGERPPKTSMVYPDRAPDFEIEDFLGPNQAAIYRIDNDPNILHIDPDFARLGGFDRPIIMGMCTAGYACRALIRALCPGRPEALRELKIRFTSTLEPGNPVKTQIWKTDDQQVLFRLLNAKTGEIVLNFCSAQLG